MKTFMCKKEDIKGRKYYIVDAEGKTLGRLSTSIATVLIGKDKPDYTPHVDSGAAVIVINASKVNVTGKKSESKTYKSYSGYPGGLKVTKFKNMLENKPEYIIRHAVKGMLPKNKLQARRIARLKIYKSSAHQHQAQNPIPLEVK
ncbi:MAG: 50S ribosomal protein L13 [Candidatus Saelkia tenebricola]|nr:50S ribosomal protein L13 [Candidatus Saelkia tenebricola]